MRRSLITAEFAANNGPIRRKMCGEWRNGWNWVRLWVPVATEAILPEREYSRRIDHISPISSRTGIISSADTAGSRFRTIYFRFTTGLYVELHDLSMKNHASGAEIAILQA
jgi:hypothetical protein